MEQLKAVSQNLGHENITTTFGYGIIEETRVSDLIGKIDFSRLPGNKHEDYQAEKMLGIILKKLDKN